MSVAKIKTWPRYKTYFVPWCHGGACWVAPPVNTMHVPIQISKSGLNCIVRTLTISNSLLIIYQVRVVYCKMENSAQKDHEGYPPTPPINIVTLANLSLAAGLSVEDVQKIATAITALVGRPGASDNSMDPFVSGGPPQVPVPPSAGMQLLVVWYLQHLTPLYPSCTYDVRCLELFCFGWACLILRHHNGVDILRCLSVTSALSL